MSGEIKEIVKDNDELLVLYKDNSFRTFDTLTVDVIDYITNLQQENQRLKESYCNRTDCSGRLHDSRKYPSVKQQLDLYKSVLDEIREFIKKCSFSIEGITNEYHDIVYTEDIEEILDKVK